MHSRNIKAIRPFLCFSGKSSSDFPLSRRSSAGATQVSTSTSLSSHSAGTPDGGRGEE